MLGTQIQICGVRAPVGWNQQSIDDKRSEVKLVMIAWGKKRSRGHARDPSTT